MPKSTESNNRAQALIFPQGTYLERTSRPLYALLFLLPFLIFYEFGTIFINSESLFQDQRRIVASVWLHSFFEYLGFSNRAAFIVTPLLVVIILIVLQITSRKSWRFRFGDILPMAVECLLLAIPLILLNFLLNRPVPSPDATAARNSTVIASHIQPTWFLENNTQNAAHTTPAEQTSGNHLPADIVNAVGAGIYEELVFRLILICLLMLFFQNILSFSRKNSIILSVVIAAALFSAHHHIIYINGQLFRVAAFSWPQFIFRTIAGVYFAVLFAVRGFGITAGTHASYNIIAALVNLALMTMHNFELK
jgi:hypothetical protein